MNLNSKYFDMIRLSRKAKPLQHATRRCDWPECNEDAPHPAPIAPRTTEKRYFCFDHVQQYNQSYNFFEGMSDADIEKYRRNATTGHRPTWKLGARRSKNTINGDWKFDDPLEIMRHAGAVEGQQNTHHISTGQARALGVMGLSEQVSPDVARKHYKALLKKYHPDANQGNRQYEAELQKTIKAYNYLRASGFC
ncbi:MAG: DnaJ domain-containing protein [Parvibaculales bacterium]